MQLSGTSTRLDEKAKHDGKGGAAKQTRCGRLSDAVAGCDRFGRGVMGLVMPKRRVKFFAQMLGLLRVGPVMVEYKLTQLVVGKTRAFSLCAEKVASIPGMIGVYARYAFYKQTLRHVGKDVCFGYMCMVTKPGARIGQSVYVGRFCSVGLADIGEKVMLSDGVQVLSGRHQHGDGAEGDRAMQDQAQHYQRVRIGKGSWIGTNAVVMNDVGNDAVVGAGAVVVHEVAHGLKVVGVPARSTKVAPQPRPRVQMAVANEAQQRRLVLRQAA